MKINLIRYLYFKSNQIKNLLIDIYLHIKIFLNLKYHIIIIIN